MLENIKTLTQQLSTVQQNKEMLEYAKLFDGLNISLSNANFLMDDLLRFYEKKEAAFFPKALQK